MKENVYIFEYRPPQKPGELPMTHFNSSFKDGKFQQPLFTNGYFPITAMPENIIGHPKFEELLDSISQVSPSVAEARHMTFEWILTNVPNWEVKF